MNSICPTVNRVPVALLLLSLLMLGCERTLVPPADPIELLPLAAGHVAIADASEPRSMLWGRIGGSEAERASARLLADQLRPWLPDASVEAYEFAAHRPLHILDRNPAFDAEAVIAAL